MLDVRVALLTGGSRGIRRATAIALAQAGCDVIVNYLKEKASAEAVIQAVEKLGRRGRAIQADVSVEIDVAPLVAESEAVFGKIDVLINNAGINPSKPLDQLTLVDWTMVLNRNLTSAFLVSQAVLPAMRKSRWGRMVMMSSIAAQAAGVIGPHYAASKAGMIGLAHSYANLPAKEGITAKRRRASPNLYRYDPGEHREPAITSACQPFRRRRRDRTSGSASRSEWLYDGPDDFYQ